eukprot:732231-Alexandrium_andersonii.AAC.2
MGHVCECMFKVRGRTCSTGHVLPPNGSELLTLLMSLGAVRSYASMSDAWAAQSPKASCGGTASSNRRDPGTDMERNVGA